MTSNTLNGNFPHFQFLLANLCGTHLHVHDQKLTFLSVVKQNEEVDGVWTFTAIWGPKPIIIKSSLTSFSQLLSSYRDTHKLIEVRSLIPSYFSRLLFNVITSDGLYLLGFEQLDGFSLDLAFPFLGDPKEAISTVALQILDILEDLHLNCGLIHGNLSPSTLIYRNADPTDSHLCLHDLNKAVPNGKQVVSLDDHSKLFGSLAAHQVGRSVTYLSDIESLVYLLEWLVSGTLPWTEADDWDVLIRKKEFFSSEHCALSCISKLLKYVCTVSSPSLPDYAVLRSFFENPYDSFSDDSLSDDEDEFLLPISPTKAVMELE